MSGLNNVINLSERRALQLVARELAEETFRDPTTEEQNLVDSAVSDFHAGRSVTDDETAALWALADWLEASLDWTDFQRRCAVAVLQREIGRRTR